MRKVERREGIWDRILALDEHEAKKHRPSHQDEGECMGQGMRMDDRWRCLVALSVQASLEMALDVSATSLLRLHVALLLQVARRAAFADDSRK